MVFVCFNTYNTYFSRTSNTTDVFNYGAPYDIVENKFLRFLFKIHVSHRANRLFELPFKGLWNKYYKRFIIKNGLEKERVCFLFDAHFYWAVNSKTIKYIRKFCKESFFCIKFTDKISMYKNLYKRFPTIEEMKEKCNLLFTYNIYDSIEYKIPTNPPVFQIEKNYEENTQPYSDILFVGKNKGRLNKLINIYDSFDRVGLKCLFFVTEVSDKEIIKRERIVYNQILVYQDVLKLVEHSKCIINVVQEEANGITLREFEAFFFDKLLLTDNYFLRSSVLANEKQIIYLDEDYINKVKLLINKKLEHKGYENLFNEEHYYNWLKQELENGAK